MAARRKKAGLITLSLARERTDLAEAFGKNALQSLESAGIEVCGNQELVFDTRQCIAAARKLKEQDVDCLLLLLGTWVFAPTVVDTLRAVDVPFGIWAEDNPGSFSLTAGGMVHGSLDELGLKHRFFYGSPRSAPLLEELSAFIRASACARDLAGRRLAVVGGRVPGMYTTMADIIQVKNLFGVETEHIDAVRVHLIAESLDEKEVAGIGKELLQRFGRIHTEKPALEKSIRLYIALKTILEKDGYQIAAIKCMEEMINDYACFCLASSLLNNEGFTISCEADINAALMMSILRAVSGDLAVFGDVNHLDLERDELRLVNCGSMPTLAADAEKKVDLENQYKYMGQAGGATTVFSVRGSPVTIARLFRLAGRYVMVAAEGTTVEFPRDRFKEAREYWPQALVKLDCNSRQLVQNIRSNHMHLGFGRHLAALEEFCALKGLELVALRR
jgi:L-fucose isomerase-like protein